MICETSECFSFFVPCSRFRVPAFVKTTAGVAGFRVKTRRKANVSHCQALSLSVAPFLPRSLISQISSPISFSLPQITQSFKKSRTVLFSCDFFGSGPRAMADIKSLIYSIFPIAFAGTPSSKKLSSGQSLTTRAEAENSMSFPNLTGPKITAFAPRLQLSPITMSPLLHPALPPIIFSPFSVSLLLS